MKKRVFLVILAALLVITLINPISVYAAEDTRITFPDNNEVIEINEDGYIKIKVSYVGNPNYLIWAMRNETTGVKFVNNEVTKANYKYKIRITDYAKPGDRIKVCFAASYGSHDEWCSPVYFTYTSTDIENDTYIYSADEQSTSMVPSLTCDRYVAPCNSILMSVKVNGNGNPVKSLFSLRDLTTDKLIFNRYELIGMTKGTLNVKTSFLEGHSYRAAYAAVDKNGKEYWCETLINVNGKSDSPLLDVKLLSQADPQWGSKYMGKSKYTYRSVGCLVTSYAMCEAYRLGRDITPLDLIEEEQVIVNSGGGATGGPVQNAYKQNEEQFSYQKLYELLTEGRPVILKITSESGGEHFVVAYGMVSAPKDCYGNVIESLCHPDNILICDPGWGCSTVQGLYDLQKGFYSISTLRYR